MRLGTSLSGFGKYRNLAIAAAWILLGAPQSEAAQKQIAPKPQSDCAARVAAATEVANRLGVIVHATRIQRLDKIEVSLRLAGDAASRADAGIGVVMALSANAHFEGADDDFMTWSPGGDMTYDYVSGIEAFKQQERASTVFRNPKEEKSVRIAIRAWDASPITLSWIVSGGWTGNCPAKQISPVSEKRVEVVIDPREATILAATDRCRAEEEALKAIAADIKVAFEQPDHLAVGRSITVNWSRGAVRPLFGRPTFIAFAMEDVARLQGEGILALPPHAPAPASLRFRADKLRVLVPLHMLGAKGEDHFAIRPLKAVNLSVEYIVIAKTDCGELALTPPSSRSFEILPSQPEVVIQDFFSLDKPERIVVANSGQYRLEVYKDSYKVFDADGMVVLDRIGRAPQLSPTGRFVAAMVENADEDTGGKMELFDLVAGGQIHFALEGPTLAWAHEDAFLIEGTYPRGELKIRQTLIDPAEPEKSAAPQEQQEGGLIIPTVRSLGRDSGAWETLRVKIIVDRGIALLGNQSGDIHLWELASGFSLALSPGAMGKVAAQYGFPDSPLPRGWDTGDKLRLSHYSPGVDRIASGLTEKAQKQSDFLYEHRTIPGSRSADQFQQQAMTGDWRSRSFEVAGLRVPRPDAAFPNQLEAYGIKLEELRRPESLVNSTIWRKRSAFEISHSSVFSKPKRQIELALLKDIPSAKKYINTMPAAAGRRSSGPVECQQINDRDYAWTFQTNAHGVWTWTRKGTTYWLVQMLCFWKGALSTKLYLFVGGSGKSETVINLFQPLFAGVEDVASEALTRARPFLAGDRWLLLASAGGAAAAVVDLDDLRNVKFLHRLKDAAALSHLYLSRDERFLTQLNTNGVFFVYPVAAASNWDSQRAANWEATEPLGKDFPETNARISGRWIDDEIILYTDNGYFWGSYEASHFVHLRLPGEAGLHAIAQFASVLNRPEIVRAAIEGARRADTPQLRLPPRMWLREQVVSGQKLTASIRASSVNALRSVRVFADGQLLVQQPLSGTSVDVQLQLDVPPQARWLSAMVVDERGLLSSPVSRELQPSGMPQRRLIGLMVGNDTYAEPKLTLRYAKSDARKLQEALVSNRSKYYKNVELRTLLDDEASSDSIVEELNAIVGRAGAVDTLLFFYSGHGYKGADGRFYLTPAGFQTTSAESTGLAWSRIASILRRSRARVVIILDACHSGLTGAEELGTNDEMAAELTETDVPTLILAAAKGRQVAYEDPPDVPPRWGGGVFTYALVKLLNEGRGAADKNGNGVLDVSELYAAAKTTVASETATSSRGVQTPWLERRNVFGDFALF